MKKSELSKYIHNEIVFYCDSIDEHFKGVLESMDVKVEIVPTKYGPEKYLKYYNNLTNKLNDKIKPAHNKGNRCTTP